MISYNEYSERRGEYGVSWWSTTHRAVGCLKRIDVSSETLPVDDLRRYLSVEYDARTSAHPRRYQEMVTSVFRDIGRSVREMSYSHDGGIDLLLLDGANGIEAVQIKRKEKDKIGVAEVREFTGALVDHGMTRGIFVTTIGYTKGAKDLARRLTEGERAILITLSEPESFYRALEIANRSAYHSVFDPSAPYAPLLEQHLPQVVSDSGYFE